jgi:hypothetical protein
MAPALITVQLEPCPIWAWRHACTATASGSNKALSSYERLSGSLQSVSSDKTKMECENLSIAHMKPVRRVCHYVLHRSLKMRLRRPAIAESSVVAEVVSVVATQATRSTRHAALNGHSIAQPEFCT